MIDARTAEEAPSAHSQSTTPIAQIDPVPRVSIQAFCESSEAAAVVQAAIGDRRMSKAHVKQNMGGAAAAVEAYRNAPTPNVIVIEATADRDILVEQLDELAAISATPAPRSSSSARSTTSSSTVS